MSNKESMDIQTIDKNLLTNLHQKAVVNERKCMNFDLPIKPDTWRVDTSKDVMTLREYKLQELHRFTKSLVAVYDTEKRECVMLKDLLEKVTAYTMEAIKNGGPFYTTSEVFDSIDRKFGWK